ncbi:LacI family DNA-binding transcriptional regulator [Jatrophihabitans sp. YIM 134969]
MTVSLRAVAARAGVSVRTVSNVVSGAPHVAPATRASVQAVLDELGYRPNLAARQLRRGRTGAVGLVVPEVHSPYFGQLASVVVRLAEARGLTVLIDQTEGDPERERRLLGGSSGFAVDGMILSPWSLDVDEIARRTGALPLVLLGERGGGSTVDHVGFDNVAAAREATAHLLALGRHRVAAVGVQPHRTNDTGRQRLEGYHAALRDAGRTADPRLEVAVESLHRADGVVAMRSLLAGSVVPDAVFCFTDELALGAVRVLADHGLRVPDDVAVVGFDDIEDGRFSVPTLTTVAPDKEQIAAGCLDLLAERLRDPAGPAREVVTGFRLEVRESSGGRRETVTVDGPEVVTGADRRGRSGRRPGRRSEPREDRAHRLERGVTGDSDSARGVRGIQAAGEQP